jgi:transcriptional regulator with XRE-family HTH domain
MPDLIDSSRRAGEREEALHRFVRERRQRLAPESHFLGERPRLPTRIGKPVTQEEPAEHLGISRQWYSRFEAGAPADFSTELLSRLSDLLLLSVSERAELVQLAMPELATVVSPDSTAVYEALRDIRQTVKRLWRATSEAEIVNVAGEEARGLLPHFDLIFARRLVAAEDEALFPHSEGNSGARLAAARADALRRFTPEQLKRLDALLERTPAGGLLPADAYPPDSIRGFRLALRDHGITWELPVAAHIRGSNGVGGIVGGVSTRPRHVTEFERAELSAIADLALR